jgi:hypothetical protein
MSVAALKPPRCHASLRSAPVTAGGCQSGDARPVRRTRRRLIDPATCDRDYGPEELEFMQAIDHYKRTSGRMFPTCSEVLEVVRSLGYQRVVAG